ncbi:TIR domain-containing protein [Afipia birgiae]|jgi:hypothetical protein|uniref:TIR domain-containing protein n=1 Tax=Afipia birgiae TaxID=151414 RepID=UPI00031273CC|nr:TIR domain-containing protein [Afipia birgiae]MBX9821053.1 TIR domain-containing protein [Afipia birgiae]
MSYNLPAYVVFDGDNDKWAYGFMKGWKQNDRVEFDFRDAHDLDNMTGRAQDEAYVKSNLRDRMKKSGAVIVLIGEKTKNLYKYVRWELELALELDIPIVAVNLNKKNGRDENLCPAIIRTSGRVVHVPYSREAIKHALDNFTASFKNMALEQKASASWYYKKFDA